MMCKRAQREVLHIVLTFLFGEKQAVLNFRRHSFHRTKKQRPMSRNLWLHNSLQMVHSRLARDIPRLLPRPSGSSSGLPRGPTLLGISFGSSLRGPHHRNQFLYLVLLSKPQVLWPFCFHWIFPFNRLVQLLVLPIHGLPFWSFDVLVNSLADGVPVLTHERWRPPFCLPHSWCR